MPKPASPARFLAPLALLLSLALPATAAMAEGAGSDALHLVPMDPIQVPIIEGNRADGALRVTIVLQAGSAAAADQLTATLPVLRAASVSAALEFARLYASPMRPVDAGRLAAALTTALRAQDAGVARVLVVQVRAIRS